MIIFTFNSCIFNKHIYLRSSEDVVGQLDIFVKALRPLSLVDLKAVEAKLEARITSLRGAQRKVIRTLFYDIVAMIGTNPAIMLVKERLLHPRCALLLVSIKNTLIIESFRIFWKDYV